MGIAVIILIVTGSGLIVAPPVGSTGPPDRSAPVTDCELVQLAVYELDTETPSEGEQKRYRSLSDIQQAVFDEGRAADGDFVQFTHRDRMTAADTLPPTIVFEGRDFRAHSVRGNCDGRPWYGGLVDPTGNLLVSIGALIWCVFLWRRISY